MFQILSNFSNATVTADPKKVAYTLNEVSVQLDGAAVRLYSINLRAIVGAIPQNASMGVHTLTVKSGNSVMLTQQIMIAGSSAAAYTWAPDPMHQGILAPKISDLNGNMVGDPSLSKNYVQAKAGDTVVITGTGGGPTLPALTDNTPVPPAGTYAFVPPEILIDGTPLSSGGVNGVRAPGSFSIDQVSFVVPAGLISGPHAVQLGSAVYANAIWVK